MEVECPYCDRLAVLTDSSEVYSRSFGTIWLCAPCKAWVGVHKNSETRHARKMAHARFDPLWQNRPAGTPKGKARSAAYAWLADHLGIPVKDCHIGLFDLKTCVRVIEICVQQTYTGPPVGS